MTQSLIATFLDLGDATSQHLAFSHRGDVSVSYGEETITEINLLEFRRRHPERVYVQTFPKVIEAKTGADWEWHIVGSQRTLKMRVQAKRIQSNDVLKVKHKIASSGEQQRKLLIADAFRNNMKPIYCIYCTESQRDIWKESTTRIGYKNYQTGCLLADACDVPLSVRKLSEIESSCIPWHFLIRRSTFAYKERGLIEEYYNVDDFIPLRSSADISSILGPIGPVPYAGWNAPTIDDLNRDTERDFDPIGVSDTTDDDRNRVRLETEERRRIARQDRERLYELGIFRMLVLDVRNEMSSD